MAQTVIPFGHALAQKVFGAAVFAEVSRRRSFAGKLIGPADLFDDPALAGCPGDRTPHLSFVDPKRQGEGAS